MQNYNNLAVTQDILDRAVYKQDRLKRSRILSKSLDLAFPSLPHL